MEKLKKLEFLVVMLKDLALIYMTIWTQMKTGPLPSDYVKPVEPAVKLLYHCFNETFILNTQRVHVRRLPCTEMFILTEKKSAPVTF